LDQSTLIIVIPVAIALVIVIFMSIRRLGGAKPNPAQYHYILGLKAQLEADNEEAYKHFRKTVSIDTDNVDAYLRLGNILRHRGSLERAYQVHKELSLRKGIESWQMDDIHEAMVEDLLAADHFGEAGKLLRSLHSQDKNNIKLMEKLLEVYTRARDWVNAIITAEKLAKIDREKYGRKFVSWYKLLEGKNFASDGDNHRARIAYKEALRYDENCPLAYLYIGDAYMTDGRLDDAVDWWRKLCEKFPDKSYICYDKLESTLFELGKFGIIAEIYLRILEQDSRNVRAMRALARIQVKMGKIPEAVNNLKKALKIQPDNNVVAMELFRIYKQDNNIEGMVEVAEDFCAVNPRDEDLFVCSDCGYISAEPEVICSDCGRVGTYEI
jgi:lipopolysaccharide biosynthesis regulator YciM